MRRPKPKRPTNVPPGTTTLNAPVVWFKLALRITSGTLDPDYVTRILGTSPTRTIVQGQLIHPTNPRSRISNFGLWELELVPSETDEWDMVEALSLLIARISATPATWDSLPDDADRYLDIAVNLGAMSSMIWLPPSLLRFLGERKIEARFDIYERPRT